MTVSLLHIYHTSSSVLWLQAGGEMLMIDNKNFDIDESYDGDDLIGSIIFMFLQCKPPLVSWGDENADFRGFQNIGKDFHRLLRL